MSDVDFIHPTVFVRCRSCDGAIWWGMTINGKLIPVDPTATNVGNLVVVGHSGADHVPIVHKLSNDDLARLGIHGQLELYVPHHATCPQGREWRRG